MEGLLLLRVTEACEKVLTVFSVAYGEVSMCYSI